MLKMLFTAIRPLPPAFVVTAGFLMLIAALAAFGPHYGRDAYLRREAEARVVAERRAAAYEAIGKDVYRLKAATELKDNGMFIVDYLGMMSAANDLYEEIDLDREYLPDAQKQLDVASHIVAEAAVIWNGADRYDDGHADYTAWDAARQALRDRCERLKQTIYENETGNAGPK